MLGVEPPTQHAMRSSSLSQALGATVFGAVAIFINHSNPAAGIAAAVITFALGIAFVSSSRLVLIALAATLPYAVGTYIGALFDIRFYPWPVLDAYWSATREQLTGLLLVAALVMLSGIGNIFQKSFAKALTRMRSGTHPTRPAYAFIRGLAVVIGLLDASVVARNLNTVFASGRHVLDDQMIVGSGPVGIVLALTVSLFLGADALCTRHRPWASAFAFVIFWTPTLLAGARNYFSVSMVILLAIYFMIPRRAMGKGIIAVTSVIGVLCFVVLPSMWSTNKLVGLNEWILPNSSFLPMHLGIFSRDALGVTPLYEQWQLLLPAVLRPEIVSTLAPTFAGLEVTGVGVGGNPWADTYLPDSTLRIGLFVLLTSGFFVTGAFLARFSPLAPLVTFGLMVFWGRSTFWSVLVLIVYTTLVTWPFFIGTARGKAPDTHAEEGEDPELTQKHVDVS